MTQERHFFPGGNTSKGFYSLYRYILTQDEARRIICIKGGPGTGKSTLMKKIGSYFLAKGYDVEFHHCSSDNNSLDGVVIKGLNVAVLDGTAPHIVDPINPGAVDEVLNMGDCWNEEGFKKYRTNIMDVNREVGKKFKRAYRYLGAARCILDDWANFNEEALSKTKLNMLKENLKNKLLKDLPVGHTACDRHLFLTAFTPNGIITFTSGLIDTFKNIIVLKGGPNLGQTEILSYIGDEAQKRGLFVEYYHDPFIPERLEHIAIPNLSLAIVSSNEINRFNIPSDATEVINLEDLCYKNILAKHNEDISLNSELFYSLVDKALGQIKQAKALHDDMEKYYIENIDFEKINKTTERILKKIEGYAN